MPSRLYSAPTMILMRSTHALFRRPIKLFVLAFLLFDLFEVIQIQRCQYIPPIDITDRHSERIYISSLHWNNEKILRSNWTNAVVTLANALGRDNVFVTVYESGSLDGSKDALEGFDIALGTHGIRRNITLSPITHLDEMSGLTRGEGWVDTPRGRRELRRIPYLSRLRNLALEPLRDLAEQGERFDKVLFLNDVVFNTDDVLRLLKTNGGHYSAACSLDFSRPPDVYDTFALRDAKMHEMLMQTWPYFRAKQSRQAILANRPVPVTSCWNVAMPALPFVSYPPLRFRGIPDSLASFHLEGSECCLIHMDNPIRHQRRTYINPHVLVGYSSEAYNAVHPQQLLLSSWHIYKALWENRIRRWITSPALREWRVQRKVQEWKAMDGDYEEVGRICVIPEMQVLDENGWRHV